MGSCYVGNASRKIALSRHLRDAPARLKQRGATRGHIVYEIRNQQSYLLSVYFRIVLRTSGGA
jgi:hypothetical protein